MPKKKTKQKNEKKKVPSVVCDFLSSQFYCTNVLAELFIQMHSFQIGINHKSPENDMN